MICYYLLLQLLLWSVINCCSIYCLHIFCNLFVLYIYIFVITLEIFADKIFCYSRFTNTVSYTIVGCAHNPFILASIPVIISMLVCLSLLSCPCLFVYHFLSTCLLPFVCTEMPIFFVYLYFILINKFTDFSHVE